MKKLKGIGVAFILLLSILMPALNQSVSAAAAPRIDHTSPAANEQNVPIEGTADGKTRPWAAYNAAKSAYDKALKAVNTLPAAQKNRYLAELDQEVKLHITRTMFYIDAITAGEKIKEKQQTLAYQQDLDIINDQTERAYC